MISKKIIRRDLSFIEKIILKTSKFKKHIMFFALPRSGKNAILHWTSLNYQKATIIKKRQIYGKIKFFQSDCLLISQHENYLPKDFNKANTFKLDFEPKKIILIRDLYNWIASFIQMRKILNPNDSYSSIIKNFFKTNTQHKNENIVNHVEIPQNRLFIWKEYAKKILQKDRNYFDDYILYNKWFSSKNYRREISLKLGLLSSEKGIDTVPGTGYWSGASGFDTYSFENNAQKMKVMERYKNYNREFYNEIVDKESMELNEKLFRVRYDF